MAFPVSSVAATPAVSGATSVAANMPAGILAGDVLVAFVFQSNLVDWTVAGWTRLRRTSISGTSYVQMFCRLAEGGDAFILDRSAGSGHASILIHSLRGVVGGLSGIELSPAVTMIGTSHDAPEVTASWGVADNLFLWFTNLGTADSVGYPNGYSLYRTRSFIDESVTVVLTAGKEASAASDNPDPITTSSAYGIAPITLVARGSGGGGTAHALAAAAPAAATAAGALSVAATGTITTQPLKNRAGTVLASTAIPKLTWLRLSDMQQMATWTNVSTNGSGVLSLSAAGVAVGVPGLLVLSDADGANRGVGVYTPT